MDLGLVYMVLTSAAIGLISHLDPIPEGWPVYPMITWLGAVVLMFAAIVPNAPMRTLVAGLIADSNDAGSCAQGSGPTFRKK